MAVTEPIRIAGPFAGDGVLVELDFDFETFAASDISVGITNADDVETILTLNDDYTVTLNSGSAGGSVTLLTALATGTTAHVYGDAMPYTRTGNIISNPGGFFPAVVNAAFDRVHVALLQLAAKASRALLLPVDPTSVAGLYPVVLPDGSIGWSNGTGADIGLREDLADPAGGAMIGVKQTGASALNRVVSTKVIETLSSPDFAAADGSNDTAAIQAGLDENSNRAMVIIGSSRLTAQIEPNAGQLVSGQATGSRLYTTTASHHLLAVKAANVQVRDLKLSGVNGSTVQNNSAIVWANSDAVGGGARNIEATGMSGSPFYATGNASDFNIDEVYVHDLTGTFDNQADVMLYTGAHRIGVYRSRLEGNSFCGVYCQLDSDEHDIAFNRISGKRAYGAIDYDNTPLNSRILFLGNRVENIDGAALSGVTGAGIYTAGTGGQRIALNDVSNCNLSTTTETLAPAGIAQNEVLVAPSLRIGNMVHDNNWYGGMIVTTTVQSVSSIGETYFENRLDQFYVKASSNILISGLSVTALSGSPSDQFRGLAVNSDGTGQRHGIVISGFRGRGSGYGITGLKTDLSAICGANVTESTYVALKWENSTGLTITASVLDTNGVAFEALGLNAVTYSVVDNIILNTAHSIALAISGTCTGLRIGKGVIIVGEGNPMNRIDNDGAGCIVEAYGTAAPTLRKHQVGDRVINSAPSVGQPKAWVCTVTGTPGTWVSEGNL